MATFTAPASISELAQAYETARLAAVSASCEAGRIALAASKVCGSDLATYYNALLAAARANENSRTADQASADAYNALRAATSQFVPAHAVATVEPTHAEPTVAPAQPTEFERIEQAYEQANVELASAHKAVGEATERRSQARAAFTNALQAYQTALGDAAFQPTENDLPACLNEPEPTPEPTPEPEGALSDKGYRENISHHFRLTPLGFPEHRFVLAGYDKIFGNLYGYDEEGNWNADEAVELRCDGHWSGEWVRPELVKRSLRTYRASTLPRVISGDELTEWALNFPTEWVRIRPFIVKTLQPQYFETV